MGRDTFGWLTLNNFDQFLPVRTSTFHPAIPDGQNLEDVSGTADDTVHENGVGSGIRTLGSSYGTARHLDRRDRTVQ